MLPRIFSSTILFAITALTDQILSGNAAGACPICCVSSGTCSEEIDRAQAVIVAELVHLPSANETETSPGKDHGEKETFRIAEIFKGEMLVSVGDKIEATYHGNAPLGGKFIILSDDGKTWDWPIHADQRTQNYFHSLPTLPAHGPERLAFFIPFLEDKDYSLARDSTNSPALAPDNFFCPARTDLCAMHDFLGVAVFLVACFSAQLWIRYPCGGRNLA